LAIAGTENTSAEEKNAAFFAGYKTPGRRPREIECDSLVTLQGRVSTFFHPTGNPGGQRLWTPHLAAAD
jgi:hypothetical protein